MRKLFGSLALTAAYFGLTPLLFAANLETYVNGFSNGAEVWFQLNHPEPDEVLFKHSDGRFERIYKGEITAVPHFQNDRPLPSRPKRPVVAIDHDVFSVSGMVFGTKDKSYFIDSRGETTRLKVPPKDITRVFADVPPYPGHDLATLVSVSTDKADKKYSHLYYISSGFRGSESGSGVVHVDLKKIGASSVRPPTITKNIWPPAYIIEGTDFVFNHPYTGVIGLDPSAVKPEPLKPEALPRGFKPDMKAFAPQAAPGVSARSTIGVNRENGRLRYEFTPGKPAEVWLEKDGSSPVKLLSGSIEQISVREDIGIIPNKLQRPEKLYPHFQNDRSTQSNIIISTADGDLHYLQTPNAWAPDQTQKLLRLRTKIKTPVAVHIQDSVQNSKGKQLFISIWKDEFVDPNGLEKSSKYSGVGETYLVSLDDNKFVKIADRAYAIGGLTSAEIDSKGYVIFHHEAAGGDYYPQGKPNVFDLDLPKLASNIGRTGEAPKVTELPTDSPVSTREPGRSARAKPTSGSSAGEKPPKPWVPKERRSAPAVPDVGKAAQLENVDPYRSEMVERLGKFKEEMNKRIMGQGHAVDSMSDAVLAHVMNPRTAKRPISFFAVGANGGGKTEFGRAIAGALFGDDSAYRAIPLGEIKTEQELSSLLGAGKGYVGSDSPGKFEAALLEMPNGGVIIMDEASNMGAGVGNGTASKDGFFKSFYNFAEEGKFYSSTNSKTYDLSKYIFIYTGNDGEKLFQGSNSEQQLLRLFNENKSREQVKGILKSSGVPEAFLNRMNDVILFKPLSTAEIKQIAKVKFLDPLIDEYQRAYNVRIKYDPDFVDQLVRNFYNYSDGARGIRNIVEDRIGAGLAEAVHESQVAGLKDKNVNLALRLVQTSPPAGSGASAEGAVTLRIDSDLKRGHFYEKPLTEFVKRDRFVGLSAAGNPLDNPDLLNRLEAFKTKLSERLIGQDAIVNMMDDAVVSHYMNPELKKKPLSMMVVGSTGTGKTELGRAIAEALYGSDGGGSLQVISLGNYKSMEDLNNLFGAPSGYIGSDKPGEFEAALQKMKNGGVIILDEASNMGGGSAAQKEAMFKAFYELKEEGKWKSKLTGVEYDLSNYVFLYTGNDGEKLFQGVSADDLRLSTYEQHKARSAVQKLLTENAVPEAFLGRQDFVGLMKPLVRSEMEVITRNKFLLPVLKGFENSYPGIQFVYDENFVKQLARTFFTHDQGARSLRPVIEQQIGSAISAVLFKYRNKPEQLKGLKLKLQLSDSAGTKPYTRSSVMREVLLSVEHQLDGQKLVLAKDLTNVAPVINKPFGDYAKLVAFHEAGHAIANDPALTHQKLDYVTIQGADDYGGYARYKTIKGSYGISRSTAVANIAKSMSGQLASMMAGFEKEAGWNGDLETIRRIGSDYLIKYGMSNELAGVRVDAQGLPILNAQQSEIFQKELDQLIAEAFELAQTRLKNNWEKVRTLSARLLRQGAVSAEEFNKVMEATPTSQSKSATPRLVKLNELFRGGSAPVPNPCLRFQLLNYL